MTKKNDDTYVLVRETVTDKAVVRVYRPVLTPEEYARRRKIVEEGLVRYYKRVVASGVDWDASAKKGLEALGK